MTLSITACCVPCAIMHVHYAEFRKLFNVMLNVVKLNVVMLNVVKLNVIMLNVVMLNFVMLNFVMLNFIMWKTSELFEYKS
jgi:hypothetical protein